jgi:hypothetical protein
MQSLPRKNSGKKTTTDNNGYFKLPVPFNGNEIDFAVRMKCPVINPRNAG